MMKNSSKKKSSSTRRVTISNTKSTYDDKTGGVQLSSVNDTNGNTLTSSSGGNGVDVHDTQQVSMLNRLSASIDEYLRTSFESLGGRITRRPVMVIVLCVFVGVLAGAGLMNLRVETRPQKLYTLPDTTSQRDFDLIDDVFTTLELNSVYVESNVASAPNLLTKSTLLKLWDVQHTMLNTPFEGTTVEQVPCARVTPGGCLVFSVLNAWHNNRTLLEEDSDIMATINSASTLNQFGLPLGAKRLLGGMGTSGGNIVSAKALVIHMRLLPDPKSRAEKAEEAIGDAVLAVAENYPNLRIYPISGALMLREFARATNEDLVLVVYGCMTLFMFGVLVLSRPHPIHSRGVLAFASLVAVILSVLAGYGLSSALGVPMSTSTTILIFILVGIGLDDSFVIMGVLLQTESLSPSERIVKAIGKAGPSITVTSFTNGIAFLGGLFTQLPAMQQFAVFACFSVFFTYFFQVTFFVACVMLDQLRQSAGRLDFLCCFRLDRAKYPNRCFSNTEYSDTDVGLTTIFIDRVYAPLLMKRATKMCVILISAIVFGASVYGLTQVENNVQVEWFIPDSSFVTKARSIANRYFGGENSEFRVFFRPNQLDYFASQANLLALRDRVTADEYTFPNSVQFWLTDYLAWVGQTNSTYLTNGVVNDRTFFESSVKVFRSGPGRLYQHDIVMSSSGDAIEATLFRAWFVELRDSASELAAMDRCREIAGTMGAGCFSWRFLLYDGYLPMVTQTIINVSVTAFLVALVILVLLVDGRGAFLVMSMVSIVDVVLWGGLWWVGLEFNFIASIMLASAVGISVDYSTHVTHSFLVAVGTLNERAVKALHHIGGAVINGGLSTLLMVLWTGLAETYSVQYFFRCMMIVVCVGLWNGVVLLPVLLSLIGSKSYMERGGNARYLRSNTTDIRYKASPKHLLDA